METLAEALGQKSAAEDLVRRLLPPDARVALRGPSGSGKSTIADMVADGLAAYGAVIRLVGDPGQFGTKFLALNRALAGARPRRSVREAFPTGMVAPLRLIPYAGGAAADLARLAVASAGKAKPEFLSADQQDLLQGLQILASGRSRTFIVVDNVGWLDQDTATLLLCLDREEVRTAFPFADGLSILIVEDTDAASTMPEALSRVARASRSPPLQPRARSRCWPGTCSARKKTTPLPGQRWWR